MKSGALSNLRQLIGLRDQARGRDGQIPVLGSFVQSLRASQRLHRVGDALRLGCRLLLLQGRLDFRLYFVQRLQARLLFRLRHE